jgi:hypothetical protein
MRYADFRSQVMPLAAARSKALSTRSNVIGRAGQAVAEPTNGQAMPADLSELHSGCLGYTWLRLSKN